MFARNHETVGRYESSERLELFCGSCIPVAKCGQSDGQFYGMIKEHLVSQQRVRAQTGRAEDGLGPNTDIGARLRALYGAVQDEGVPNQLLDLLEKLDGAEQVQKSKSSPRSGE